MPSGYTLVLCLYIPAACPCMWCIPPGEPVEQEAFKRWSYKRSMGFLLAPLHRLLSQITVHCGSVPSDMEHQYISSSLDHHSLHLSDICNSLLDGIERRHCFTSVQQYRRLKTAVGPCSATHIDQLSQPAEGSSFLVIFQILSLAA